MLRFETSHGSELDSTMLREPFSFTALEKTTNMDRAFRPPPPTPLIGTVGT